MFDPTATSGVMWEFNLQSRILNLQLPKARRRTPFQPRSEAAT
jgi:hypothetical protein